VNIKIKVHEYTSLDITVDPPDPERKQTNFHNHLRAVCTRFLLGGGRGDGAPIISSSSSPVSSASVPIKTGTPPPPPCARKPLRVRPLAGPTAVYVCGSMSSARRSSSVTPSETRSSSSSVRLRAALLCAALCVDDALPFRACREGPGVLVAFVAGLLSFLVRVARGESSTTIASGSSSSSSDCSIFR
jgi:hypothetical protein